MKFKGTIIITDPCYVVKDEDWKNVSCYDSMSDDLTNIMDLSQCIAESTLCGDWSCITSKVEKNPYDVIDTLVDNRSEDGSYEYDDDLPYDVLGQFCADAGEVGVFYLDEVLKYNPDFEDWMRVHDWCVTTVDDFDGEIEYFVDSDNDAHIVGIGNINFFTI